MDWVKGGGNNAGRKILRYTLTSRIAKRSSTNKENRFALATKDQERSRVFLTTLAELVRGGFPVEEIRMEVVNVCEIIVDEFWRAGEESTVKELRSEILQKLRRPIEVGEANSQLVGVWRRMWMLDPNSNEKGKNYLQLLFPSYTKIIGPRRSPRNFVRNHREC